MRFARILALIALCLAFAPTPALAVTGYDSAYSGESAFVTINPGETQSFQVFFSNTGTLTWAKGTATQVDLAACLEDKVTCNAQDPSEATWNSGWLSPTRYATTTQASVAPGSLATFAYNIKAPSNATGTHRFNGDLVVSASGQRIHPEGYYQDASVNAVGSVSVPTPTPTPGSTPFPSAPPAQPTPTPTPTLGTLTVNGGFTATGCPGASFVTTFVGTGLHPNTTYQLQFTRTAPPPPVVTGTPSVTTDASGRFSFTLSTAGAPAPSTYTIVTDSNGTPVTNSVTVNFVCNVLRAEPGVFDPGNTGTVTAAWQSDNTLLLTKNTATATNASAGAEITVNHNHFTSPITELGFDYKSDGWCGAGAPRFDIFTSADFSTADVTRGCLSGTHTDLGNGWTRVRFAPFAGPVFALEIIFDEGTDLSGHGTPGTVTLDNIDVNGTIITDANGTNLP